MDKTALYIAGPLLSAIGMYLRFAHNRKKSVNAWMDERRIDIRNSNRLEACPECGAKMVQRERGGAKAMVCSKYPNCRTVKWG